MLIVSTDACMQEIQGSNPTDDQTHSIVCSGAFVKIFIINHFDLTYNYTVNAKNVQIYEQTAFTGAPSGTLVQLNFFIDRGWCGLHHCVVFSKRLNQLTSPLGQLQVRLVDIQVRYPVRLQFYNKTETGKKN